MDIVFLEKFNGCSDDVIRLCAAVPLYIGSAAGRVRLETDGYFRGIKLVARTSARVPLVPSLGVALALGGSTSTYNGWIVGIYTS